MKMSEPKITEIEVYDPKKDGLTLQVTTEAYRAAFAINQTAANVLHDGLHGRVENSEVAPGLTLKKFLDDGYSGGYFGTHPGVDVVLFYDGRFQRSFSLEDPSDHEEFSGTYLSEVCHSHDAVPFLFFRSSQWDNINGRDVLAGNKVPTTPSPQ